MQAILDPYIIKTRNYMNFALRVLMITYKKYYLVLEAFRENKTHISFEGICMLFLDSVKNRVAVALGMLLIG